MSFKIFIKNEEELDKKYELFKIKKNINFEKDFLILKHKNNHLLKPNYLKLSLSCCILIVILLLNIILFYNKYSYYQLYRNYDQINNEINAQYYENNGEQGELNIYQPLYNSTNSDLIYYKEPTFIEINNSNYDYYLCAYVSNQVKNKIISSYHYEYSFEFQSNFFYDSFLHAYSWASSDDNTILDNQKHYDIIKKVHFSKKEYPIIWYLVKKDKKIYENYNNNFLLGVLEIKELKITGIVSNKSITIPVLYENYDLRLEELNPIEKINVKMTKNPPLDNQRLITNETYLNFSGWNIINKNKKNKIINEFVDYLFEYTINNPDISKIELINNNKYINVGNNTKIKKYSKEFSFQDHINCYYSKINNIHDDIKCNCETIIEVINFYDIYNTIVRENNIETQYLFKLNDFISFFKEFRNFDMNKYYPIDILK